ncbi:MAG: sugar ABC transporter ATP-binding protein [Balneolaceae bacterium]|nr:sugar ABC transporter ATP-binding protein [Balneolaceae bacterium]
MRSDRETILQVQNLSKAFGGVQALNDVHLEVKKGEVHGLIGENGAGKSTLMNILMGLVESDSGEITFDGEKLAHNDVQQSLERGISMVHQEIMAIPELTVAQNIFLGQEPSLGNALWLDEDKIVREARKLLKKLDVDIDVTRKMSTLSVAEMQVVEIARALSNEVKIIIMDEPTSSLSSQEVEQLFRVIEEQKRKGITIIYISHRMEEIFRICETVTVLRDGRFIDSVPTAELTEKTLIRMMVGRELDTVFPERNPHSGEIIFSARNLGVRGKFRKISFELRRGEVLGMAGLVGAGRTDIARAIMGVTNLDAGDLFLHGKKITIESPEEAIRAGIAWVTEDRKGSGIIPDLSVKNNLTLSCLRQLQAGLVIDNRSEVSAAGNMIDRLGIKTPGMHQKVKYLSGGNQQKVVIGKSLLVTPEVLILDEPTRGIDVGAKFEIYELIDQLARDGKAILLISSELPELLGLSHRILVLSNGNISTELGAGQASQEMIMKYAIQN